MQPINDLLLRLTVSGLIFPILGVVCQRLAKKRDGKSRVPVNELMMATPLVRKYIMEGEFDKLKSCVGNRESGSQSFDQHLTELFHKQIIDVNEAQRLAAHHQFTAVWPTRLRQHLLNR